MKHSIRLYSDVQLVDVPEMEYYAVDNQGEVCVKGTNVFHGYYKDPERTAEAIDEYGWHHTGDVGMWLTNGTLKIIDRRKHIFKLSQGEYIVPEKIESIYVKSQYIHQAFVYGESLKVSIWIQLIRCGMLHAMENVFAISLSIVFTGHFVFLLQSCVVAIVVPDVDVLKCWAHENRIPGTLTVLCNNAKVKELIQNDMLNWGKQSGLKSFEQVSLL